MERTHSWLNRFRRLLIRWEKKVVILPVPGSLFVPLEFSDRLLMGILRIKDVDVVLLNQAPLALRYRVLRDGVLLYCRDPNIRVEFTAHTVSAYPGL